MNTAEPTREELHREVEHLRERLEEREEALRTLQHREAAYQRLFEHTTSSSFVFDVEHDGTLQLRSHQLPEEELADALLDHPEVREQCLDAARERQPSEQEVTYEMREVEECWRVTVVPVTDASGQVCRLLGAAAPAMATISRQTLRETRLRHQRLLQLLPDAVAIADRDGTVLYLNDAGRKLLGVERQDELQGGSFWDLVHPRDWGDLQRRLEQMRQRGETTPIELTLYRLDGSEVEVEAAAVSILYEGQPAVLVTAHDLSGRRAIERALTETQELFYNAFHLGPAALGIIALSSATVVDANEQFEHVSGYARENLQYASVEELGLWDDPAEFGELRRRLDREGRIDPHETTICRADGARRTVLLAAQRIDVHSEACMLVCAVDITERKHALIAEQESRSLLTKIFNASAAPIIISRLDDGTYIDVNEAYAQLSGYTREELLDPSMSAMDLWAEPAQREAFVERLHSEEQFTEEEIRLRRRDGEVRVLVCSIQRIQVRGEDAMVAVLNDITQHQQAQEALKQAKLHAEEMERMKTTLLTNLTHEVRTPLTVILGFSSVLREGVREEYERFVTLIERSGRRLLLMLDAMLDLAQLEAGTLDVEARPCNAADVVREATDSLRPMAQQKGLRLEVDIPFALRPMVRFEYDILKRVLVNLLDNAIKFTDEGEVGVTLDEQDNYLYIKVHDTGVGIEEGYLPHAFDPFSQENMGMDRGYQGTGLGLTVSKRLIELGGGAISVDTEKGRGSVFTIELPFANVAVASEE